MNDSNEGRLEWHDLTALADLPMPVTARHVVEHYIREGRFTDALYGGLTTAEGPVFAELNDF